MKCRHPIELLLGTGDGIVCRGCGRTFDTFAELDADRTGEPQKPEPQEAEKPKRTRKKKTE